MEASKTVTLPCPQPLAKVEKGPGMLWRAGQATAWSLQLLRAVWSLVLIQMGLKSEPQRFGLQRAEAWLHRMGP